MKYKLLFITNDKYLLSIKGFKPYIHEREFQCFKFLHSFKFDNHKIKSLQKSI